MTRFLYIIPMVFMLSGCVDNIISGVLDRTRDDIPTTGFGGSMGPRPFMLSNIPGGDDSYSAGFRDGCETIIGIVGEGFNRTYGMAYDVDRGLKDREYYAGYRAGHVYCLFYTDYDQL